MEDKRIDILPATRNTCPLCGEKHKGNDGHNTKSLYYRYLYFRKNGRFPEETDTKL